MIDDDALVRDMLRICLERYGFDVTVAPSGREGMECFRNGADRIDVVLLDLHLPRDDGPTLLRAMHEIAPDTPVCFMAASSAPYASHHLLKMGAAHVFQKPFYLAELTAWLSSMVRAGGMAACA